MAEKPAFYVKAATGLTCNIYCMTAKIFTEKMKSGKKTFLFMSFL
jgi:hypothetical protein